VTCVTPGVPVVVETLVITGAGPVGGGGVTVTKIANDAEQQKSGLFSPVLTTSVVDPTPTAVTVAGPIGGRVPWVVWAS